MTADMERSCRRGESFVLFNLRASNAAKVGLRWSFLQLVELTTRRLAHYSRASFSERATCSAVPRIMMT